jgi:hypothetical protein
MSTAVQERNIGARRNASASDDYRGENLRDSPMMAHLLDALEEGRDVGHYGRLTFCMVARHFMEEDEIVKLLAGQPDQDETKARAMLMQCQKYNPPKRERILQWQAEQEFPICPDPENPAACNVYREIQFPDEVYRDIQEFYEEQAEARE